MAAFEDLFKGNIGTGLAVGIGALVLGPVLVPALTSVLRPAAKAAIKGGIYVYDLACEALGQVNEMTGDIVAEARSEMPGKASSPTSGAG